MYLRKLLPLHLLLLTGCQSGHDFEVFYTPQFENINHPVIGYWFFTPDLLEDERYLKDLDDLAQNSPYDLIYLTPRGGSDFHDTAAFYHVLEKLVRRASRYNIGIGLQIYLGRSGSDKLVKVGPENGQAMIVTSTILLDDKGQASYSTFSKHVRYKSRDFHIKPELVRAWAFERTGEGNYLENSLKDITGQCMVTRQDGNDISLAIDAGRTQAGKSAFLITAHYMNYGSLYGNYHFQSLESTYGAYSGILLAGTNLDEFGNTRVTPTKYLAEGDTMNEQIYSKAMSNAFMDRYGTSLEETILHMHYVPDGQYTKKLVAINRYMDIMRKGPERVEKRFYEISKELFGPSTFIGVHNTYHNSLVNDEVWATGASWWQIARDYGHTDEHLIKPYQMGVSYANPLKDPIYNMFYSPDTMEFYRKAMNDLRFNIRTHYHAIHDLGRWGLDIQDPHFQKMVSEIERGTKLLNRFDPPKPKIELLLVFGMEGLCNWYPDSKAKNPYHLNGKMKVGEKAQALWEAGYFNAVIPSDEIVDGKVSVDEIGQLHYNGHIFKGMVFINPQYSKEQTIRFLEDFTSSEGKLMMDGKATHDFEGNDIASRFNAIYEKSTVQGFHPDRIPELGCVIDTLMNGSRMNDGSVILTDFGSLVSNTPAPFNLSINGDSYTGEYMGLMAIKVSSGGYLEKLACRQFKELKKNGKTILALNKPSDMFLFRCENGKYSITLEDATESIMPVIVDFKN